MRGAELAGTVLPAYDVGGDWFDHSADADGAWLALADAAGKGGRASAASALSLAAFRAARQAGAPLVDAAILMDQAVVGFGDPSMFVTALIARWHAASRSIEWLACGHPLPCILTADGRSGAVRRRSSSRPSASSTAIGWRRTPPRSRPDDRVVFFSDGVVERRSIDGPDGRRGFVDHVALVTEPSAASLLTHIVSHVSGLHETPLDDDATVIVLRVLDDRSHEPSTTYRSRVMRLRRRAAGAPRGAAFFDLDRTLIRRSSMLAMAPTLRRHGLIGWRSLARATVWHAVYLVRGVSSKELSQVAGQTFRLMRGWPVEEFRALIAEEIEPLAALAFPDAITRMRAHQARGEPASSSPPR